MSTWFHDSYAAARTAFRERATAAGFTLTAHDVGQVGPDGGDLSIDIAVKANGPIRKAVVVSSGTHGVEGYFGSAVQLRLLTEDLAHFEPAPGQAVVLIHAVNPFGFAHVRRVNEDSVDLNRNFRKEGDVYEGAPDGYHKLYHLLNPASPPKAFDPWLLKALYYMARDGFGTLKDAIAGGQYAYNQGIFFGGHGPSRSLEILKEALPPLLGGAERVVHLDLHTGSGKWGTYIHAVDLPVGSDRVAQLKREFGASTVQGLDNSGVLYVIHGVLGAWLQEIMPHVQYDCMLTEFGTYNNISVLATLRHENRVWWHARDDPKRRAEARRRIFEAFCPASPTWRTACTDQAQATFGQAMAAVFGR